MAPGRGRFEEAALGGGVEPGRIENVDGLARPGNGLVGRMLGQPPRQGHQGGRNRGGTRPPLASDGQAPLEMGDALVPITACQSDLAELHQRPPEHGCIVASRRFQREHAAPGEALGFLEVIQTHMSIGEHGQRGGGLHAHLSEVGLERRQPASGSRERFLVTLHADEQSRRVAKLVSEVGILGPLEECQGLVEMVEGFAVHRSGVGDLAEQRVHA